MRLRTTARRLRLGTRLSARATTALLGVAVAAGVGAGVAPGAHAGEAPEAVTVVNAAHRGASAYFPENTLLSFREGIALGGDFAELDVQRSKDGELVVIHDTGLARTTNVEELFPDRAPWKVSDFTYSEMRGLDAGSWKDPKFAGEQIPTLAESIQTIRNGRAGMLLEIKAPDLYPGIEGDVAAEMNTFPGYIRSAVSAGRLIVQSFSVDSMKAFKELEPSVPVGLLGTPTIAQLPEVATWADQINPHHYS
ncbi:MAG TPA: glycerophosphodiester phosphodiesterase family protein, partial [Demequina sp.]|nr:glycerophosphodiester phosphodiesterase family protein [Demequina sp.]